MMLIRNLEDNRKIIFDTGRFDEWCVYLVDSNGHKTAPRDENYFGKLKEISNIYPKDKVYTDFIKIYDLTTQNIDMFVLDLIDQIAKTYLIGDRQYIKQWFSVVYAGMIAEENKKNTILKKRIKRLGLYQVLILNMPVYNATKFSKGKKWRELDNIMKNYGF